MWLKVNFLRHNKAGMNSEFFLHPLWLYISSHSVSLIWKWLPIKMVFWYSKLSTINGWFRRSWEHFYGVIGSFWWLFFDTVCWINLWIVQYLGGRFLIVVYLTWSYMVHYMYLHIFSKVIYSCEPLHIDKQRQDNQLEPIYNSSVPIQHIAFRTSRAQWKIKTDGERGSRRSMVVALHDDDEDDIYISSLA